MALLAVAGCAGSPSRPAVRPTPEPSSATPHRAQGLFYASIASADGAVDAVSVRTGKVVRQVAPGQRDGMSVVGVSSGGDHRLLVTYSRGPACSSGVAGCGPRPHTCGAEVVRVDVADGTTALIWRSGPDDLLRSAALSPDGTLLAAKASPCVPSYFNDHLLVRRLSTGQSWTIGAGIPRCHWLGDPEWAADSRHIVLTYAAPTGKQPYTGADGVCTATRDNELVTIDALRPQPSLAGTVRPPRRSCSWRSVATLQDTVYAVEACGHDSSRLDGAANLVQLTSTLQPDRTWRIGQCTDGDSVAADRSSGVLVAAYLFCNPPPRGQKLRQPITVLDQLQGERLHRIAAAPGGNTAWDELAW